MIYLITSLLIITSYLSYIVCKYGVLTSWSASYYKLKEKKYFFFVMVLFPLFLGMSHPTLLMGLAVCSLWFVGAAGAYDDAKIVHRVHFAFAGLAIVLAMMLLWIELKMWYMVLIFALSIIPLLFIKKKVWWIEVSALTIVYSSLFMHYGTHVQ